MSSGTLAALQYGVRYLDGNGGRVGSAGGIACATLVDVALATHNDGGRGLLRAAMIDLEGFPVPAAISTCRLRVREEPMTSSFSVSLIDAATPHTVGDSIADPVPAPEVTAVVARDATPGDALSAPDGD